MNINTDLTANKVIDSLSCIGSNFCKLLLLVGPVCSGKTECLCEVSERINVPYLNLGVGFSKKLINLTSKQQVIRVSGLTKEIINSMRADVILVDNTEVLFNPALKVDPIRLFLNCSRNKTLAVSITGKYDNGNIIYAEPQHPEHKRIKVENCDVITF